MIPAAPTDKQRPAGVWAVRRRGERLACVDDDALRLTSTARASSSRLRQATAPPLADVRVSPRISRADLQQRDRGYGLTGAELPLRPVRDRTERGGPPIRSASSANRQSALTSRIWSTVLHIAEGLTPREGQGAQRRRLTSLGLRRRHLLADADDERRGTVVVPDALPPASNPSLGGREGHGGDGPLRGRQLKLGPSTAAHATSRKSRPGRRTALGSPAADAAKAWIAALLEDRLGAESWDVDLFSAPSWLTALSSRA